MTLPQDDPYVSELWSTQKKLTAQFKELQAQGASEAELKGVADQIDDNVRNLIEAGQVEEDEAWALAASDTFPSPRE